MPASKAKNLRIRLSKARFRELVEEATVDAWGQSEQAVGWLTMISDNVDFPFGTEVLGVNVSVAGVDLTVMGEIVAVCQRGRRRQEILLLDLSLPSPPPAGADWIEAYRLWRGGAR